MTPAEVAVIGVERTVDDGGPDLKIKRAPCGDHRICGFAPVQPDRASASQTFRHVADQIRPEWPKLGSFIDSSEADVLAHMNFPAQHRTKIDSNNPLERLNKEVKTPCRCHRHLSQRRRHHSPDRRSAARGQPSMPVDSRSRD